MNAADWEILKTFESRFGGSLFREEPGTRWLYEKDGRCYAIPQDMMPFIRKSLRDNVDYLVGLGTEVEYNPEYDY